MQYPSGIVVKNTIDASGDVVKAVWSRFYQGGGLFIGVADFDLGGS